MPRRVQFLGIRLPLSHPVLSMVFPSLAKHEREALRAVELAGTALIVVPGKTSFTIGKAQGFSKEYMYTGKNDYTEVMTDSDAALLFRGGIVECEAFRDPDFPAHRTKVATYPSQKLMSCLRVRNPGNGMVYNVTDDQARIVSQLIRKYNRAKPPKVIDRVGGSFWHPPLDQRRFRTRR